MNQLPKISVIMPSLNQGAYIREAIQSVIRQDHPSVELIIIDGGSTDNSLRVIREFSGRIHYWQSEKDNGQSHAINKGMARATGVIATWLNSDDRYLPGALTSAAQLFARHPDATLLHGRAELFGEGRRTKIIGPSRPFEAHHYLPYMRFPQPASFIKMSALKSALPLNEDLHYGMDFEMVAKIILTGGKAIATDDVLASYRLHPAAKTNREDLFLKEWTEIVLNIFESVNGGASFSNKLKALGLDSRRKPVVYPCTRSFSEFELQQVYLEHLVLHFHHHYRHFNYKGCEMMRGAINNEDKNFARRSRLGTYQFRLKYLPALLKWKRRLET